MSSVFQLFGQMKIESPSDPKTVVTMAVVKILSSRVRLARVTEELSKHLDAVDHTIDALDDTDSRTQLKQATKLNREGLTMAMLELSRTSEITPPNRTCCGNAKIDAIDPKLTLSSPGLRFEATG